MTTIPNVLQKHINVLWFGFTFRNDRQCRVGVFNATHIFLIGRVKEGSDFRVFDRSS